MFKFKIGSKTLENHNRDTHLNHKERLKKMQTLILLPRFETVTYRSY